MNKQYDIFISYRREGGKDYARNLTSELISRGYQPFLDFDELKDGKFDKRIMDAIESAPVFLFILSPGCLDRCVNEDDWVREEILHAVKCNRHIIPVDFDSKFDGFPSADDFPTDVKQALGQHQFTQIQTETLYKPSIDIMVNERIKPAIEEYQREREKSAGAHGAEIHIETDMDCHVQRFHKEMIVAKVDEENVIHLPKGKHKLQFIAVENPKVKDSREYKVEDVNESDYIDVFLKEKAGIVSVESEELEDLKRERDELRSKLSDTQDKLRTLADSLSTKETQFKQSLKTLETDKYQLNNTIANLQTEIQSKNQLIKDIEAKLSISESKSKKLSEELKVYKDKELRERQAKAEAERKEAERKAKKEALRKAQEAEKCKQIMTFKVGNVAIDMIRVEGGTFTMGATSEQGSDADDDEKPAHQVTLSSYYIGKYEVTQALWKAVMGKNPSYFKSDNLPVEQVSWIDCQDFVKKLNAKTGKTFRLPTEAEWEFAARGGNKTKGYKYSGSNDISKVAWYVDNSGVKTHPVGTKQANELGLYDMSGNVWEWCNDWYGSYSSSSQKNPTGPSSGSYRVNRGGSWSDDARDCRVSCRCNNTPGNRCYDLGLRLVLSE